MTTPPLRPMQQSSQSAAQQQPVVRAQIDNYDALMTAIPEEMRFLRFETIPETIIQELVGADKTFYLERDDKFKSRRTNQATYKLAVQDFKFMQGSLRRGNWQKQKGPFYQQQQERNY